MVQSRHKAPKQIVIAGRKISAFDREVYEGVFKLNVEHRLLEVENQIKEAKERIEKHQISIGNINKLIATEAKEIVSLLGGIRELKKLNAND